MSCWDTGDGGWGRRRAEDVEDGWRDGRKRMGGAERLCDLKQMLQQSIRTAGFSKQFPDDGGGVTERKRQKRQCSHKMCLVSELLYLIFLVTVFMSAVFEYSTLFLTPGQRCFQSSFSVYLLLLYNHVKIGPCLGRLWTRPPSCSLGFPLGAQNDISVESAAKWDLDHGSICTVLSLLIPPLRAWFLRVYFALVLQEFSTKILLKGRNNRNSRTWTKYLCVCLKEKSTLNTVTQLLAACFSCLGPFSSLTYIYSCCG